MTSTTSIIAAEPPSCCCSLKPKEVSVVTTTTNTNNTNATTTTTTTTTVVVTENSFYRRPLPECCIGFASPFGKELFREALEQGFMEGYFELASTFHTQSEPAYCGLGTLTTVLNALNIDPRRKWKGPWRWFSEELLDCCAPLEVVRKQGITLMEFVCLARCNGANVETFYGSKSTLEHFRECIKRATTTENLHMIVAYDRKGVMQTGAGHFSPIGGYNSQRDLVLVLDVARFKYPPHWISTKTLFEATLPIDETTGMSRGYMLMGRTDDDESHISGSLLCRISSGSVHWSAIVDVIMSDKESFADVSKLTAQQFLTAHATRIAELLRQHISEFSRQDTGSKNLEDIKLHKAQIELIEEIHSTKLYQTISCDQTDKSLLGCGLSIESICIILLAFPDVIYSSLVTLPPAEILTVKSVLEDIDLASEQQRKELVREIKHWKELIHTLLRHCKCGKCGPTA